MISAEKVVIVKKSMMQLGEEKLAAEDVGTSPMNHDENLRANALALACRYYVETIVKDGDLYHSGDSMTQPQSDAPKHSAKRRTALGQLSKDQIDKLLLIGQRMSNWLFNAKQVAGVSRSFSPAQIKADAAALQAEWDAVKYEESDAD